MMYTHNYHQGDLSNYNFLVTGGAGFVGSNVVEYLLQYGAAKVRVLDNFSTGSRENFRDFKDHPSLEIIEGDIRNLITCRLALNDIHYVSHQAALGSVPRSIDDPIATHEVNVNGFLNILVAARDAGVKRMIYAASSSAYGDDPGLPKIEENIGNPLSPYAVTKYVNELYAGVFSKIYGIHTIGLRYFNVFGPRQNPQGPYAAVIPLFIKAALDNSSPFINGDGNHSRDFTFVENVVQANIKALFCEQITKHETINIAMGQRTTLNQLWKHIIEIAGVSLAVNYRAERKGDVKDSLASIKKAKKLIGYQPSVSVLRGLQLTVDRFNHAV